MQLKQCENCGAFASKDDLYYKISYGFVCDKCFVELEKRRIDDIRESADTE